MNPLLKEIHLDRLVDQLAEADELQQQQQMQMNEMMCVCKAQQNGNYGGMWPQCGGGMPPPTAYQQEMMRQNQRQQQQQFDGNAIPQTFLPQQVNQPMPPFDQNTPPPNGPFNPFCSPLYPPGCPTPGCPGSYPGYQPPSNLPQPQLCYQQEFCMPYPGFGNMGAGPPGPPMFLPRL